MKINYFVLIAFIFGAISCEPYIDEKIDIGNPPVASFEITPGDSLNDYILTNTSEGTFISKWDIESVGSMEGKEVTAHFSFKGEYDITLTTFNKGGYATLTKTVTVEKDDPSNCTGNYQLLTNCSSKTWTLAQEAGALVVGPNLDEVWWQSSSQDLEDRFCLFNDKYIFDSNGNYTYDNQGDFYADTDGNGNIFPPELGLTPGCHPSTDWPDNFKDWDSGTHKFTITESTITVSGQGAYIGLYKVGTSSEVDKPQSSVTYNILELSADRMVIYTDYGGLVWKMTLTSSE